MEKNKSFITDLSFDFAQSIIIYCDILYDNKKFNISNQLIRSGTSIGANISEAQHAESKLDFIHKMKIASKEAAETEYWLKLCNNNVNYPDCNVMLNKLISIQKILSKIISTSKRSLVKHQHTSTPAH